MRGFALLAAAALGSAGLPDAAPAAARSPEAPLTPPPPPDAATAAAVRAGVDAWSAGNYEAAAKAWQGPAAKGDADALFNLGQAYKLGRGVTRDLAKAEACYSKAAHLGHIAAADNYGILLFQTGRQQAALPWLQSAADRGEPRAMYVLGIASYNGDFAPRDWVRAYALITRAAAAGLAQATESLATMNQTIPLAQRQMGVSLASELEQKAADARGREFAAADLAGEGPAAAPAPKPAPAATYLPPPSDAPAPPQPAPQKTPAQQKPAMPAARPAAASGAGAVGGGGAYRIQLGAFGVKANADALWSRLRSRPEIAGHARQDVPGTVTRLLATGYSKEGANRACAALRAAALVCLVVAP